MLPAEYAMFISELLLVLGGIYYILLGVGWVLRLTLVGFSWALRSLLGLVGFRAVGPTAGKFGMHSKAGSKLISAPRSRTIRLACLALAERCVRSQGHHRLSLRSTPKLHDAQAVSSYWRTRRMEGRCRGLGDDIVTARLRTSRKLRGLGEEVRMYNAACKAPDPR